MMNCFSCFSGKGIKDEVRKETEQLTTKRAEYQALAYQEQHLARNPSRENTKKETAKEKMPQAQSFTFRELATATRNFGSEYLLGEGGFGRVYKGKNPNTGQVVAVKQLDKNGAQGIREFRTEVTSLSMLNHTNLVDLIGYCDDGNQMVLVYEYMPMGSLDKHLFAIRNNQAPLSWHQRMKIALDAALGLEYLHEKMKPPIIYRDLKSSNILLDDQYNAKLSDIWLAMFGPTGDKTSISSRIMGTYGYCAPEYISTGKINAKSDVYSYGVVMLELITGRQAVDNTRPSEEQALVNWAEPMFKDQKRYKELVDPRLGGKYPEKSLNQTVAIAVMCLQPEPTCRPIMTDVVAALIHLTIPTDEETGTSDQEKPLLTEKHRSEKAIHDAKGKCVVSIE